MRIFRVTVKLLVLAVFTVALTASAQAQATRTFISCVGNDADPCSRTAPCRTWSGAFIKTFINGEINALDPCGYGTLNITKSITLDGNGTHASILASGTTGIIVNIAPGNVNDPHRTVRLRNLSINGAGPSSAVGTRTGIDGVRILQATSVFMDNVVIQDFSQEGVEVATGAELNLTMDNVQIRNCNGTGIKLNSTAGAAFIFASLNNVRVQACAIGLDAATRTRPTIRDSVFTRIPIGIRTTGSTSIINIENSLVSFSQTVALRASTGSTIRVSSSTIMQNASGLEANGGQMVSLEHNNVFGNTVDGVFTATQSKL